MGGQVSGADAVRRNRELQRRLYGEPLGDRLRRLLGALDVSQAVLADALGVSSPMLSQLMSGRRVKIGSPAVLGRLLMLEQRVAAGDAGSRAGPRSPACSPRSARRSPATTTTSLRTVAGAERSSCGRGGARSRLPVSWPGCSAAPPPGDPLAGEPCAEPAGRGAGPQHRCRGRRYTR